MTAVESSSAGTARRRGSHPADRRRRRPPRRAARHLVGSSAGPLPRRRAPGRDAPAGHPDPPGRRLHRGARHRRRPGGVVALRGPPLLGEAPHRRRRATRPTRSTSSGITFDQMRPGCWQQQARLDDMTLNGVEAQLCFPNYPRFAGQIFLRGQDRELAKLCVEAYNDWMVDEWCAGTGGRLIPLCLVPLWDAELAAAEVRRNAARACGPWRSARCPPTSGLPSIHSGPLGARSSPPAPRPAPSCACTSGRAPRRPHTSDDSPDAVDATIIFGNSDRRSPTTCSRACWTATPT